MQEKTPAFRVGGALDAFGICSLHASLSLLVSGQRKYGHKSNGLHKALLKLFTCLPVAAVVNSKTLVLHGGLFRCPNKRERKNNKANENVLKCGNLKDLARAGTGGTDPFDGVVRTRKLFGSREHS